MNERIDSPATALRGEEPRDGRAFTLWFTGLSGAGKSTLALAVRRRVVEAGCACHVLDGDAVRRGLCSDLGFGPGHRTENVRRVAEVCRLMNDAGLVVVAALISPNGRDRAIAREIIGPDNFIEVYLDADLETCERRDPKGLYAMARDGRIREFTGVSAPYDVPERPDVVVATGTLEIDACVARLMSFLEATLRILPRKG